MDQPLLEPGHCLSQRQLKERQECANGGIEFLPSIHATKRNHRRDLDAVARDARAITAALRDVARTPPT
jgi:hypothetical protein